MEWYKKKIQWDGVGRDDARGERNGATDAIAMEEMIGKDGYVAYVNGRWWERERERENRVPGGKESPISKSSCRPVTVVPSLCWALPCPAPPQGQGLSH
jgi:hypothetical protein